MQINKNTFPKTNTKTQFAYSKTFYQYMNNNLEYSQAMHNLNKTNLQLKSCQSLHPAQGCQQTVQCCQFHVWLRPSGYEHVADITQKQYKVYKNTFYIQWKVSAISLSNKLVDRLTPEGQVHYLMTLAVALAWRWRGVAPGKCNEFRGNSTEFLVPNVAV